MGFMWFGTRDGLNKYDTQKFEVFKHSPNDTSKDFRGGYFANDIVVPVQIQ